MTLTLVAAGAVTSACTPMRQAALVYSSSVDVGLNVAAGTPSNPGIDLGIGYSQDDAAFVPVVVANECRGEAGATCNDQMVSVLGDNEQDNSAKLGAEALANADRDLASALAAQAQAAAAERDAVELVQQRQAALQSLQTPPAKPDTEGETPAPVVIDPELVAAAERALAEARVTAAAATHTSGQAQERVRQAAAHRTSLLAALDRTDRRTRRDALSVFGSFNGDASARAGTGGPTENAGPSANGGMVLGKTFSTGVASQLLTEGVRDSLVASSVAQCLEQAARAGQLGPAANRETVTETLTLACARDANRLKR